jgi:hypothetical protein
MERSINPLFNVHEKYKMGYILNPYRFGGFIMPSGLLARYDFTGNINDTSGNGYHFKENVGANLTSDRNDISDKAYDFNNDAYLIGYYVNDASPFYLSKFTISFWMKADSLSNDDPFVCCTNQALWNDGYGIIYEGGKIRFFCGHWSTVGASSNHIDITLSDTSNWHFFCASYDKDAASNQMKFKMDDGVESVATLAATLSFNSLNAIFSVGGLLNYKSDSKIDQVYVFNRELSSAEKTSLYNYYF